MNGALSSARTWTQDEPFAARPKYEIGYIASLLDDHELTIRMANEVMRVDGKLGENLELNKIFAVLSSGRLTMEKDLEKILRIEGRLQQLVERASTSAYHATANLALWHYRYGSAEAGKALYKIAIEVARKAHEPEAAAQAANFAAREALLARDPSSDVELTLARELVGHTRSHPCNFYLRKLEALALAPDRAAEVLNPSSAGQFLRPAPAESFSSHSQMSAIGQ